MNLEIWNAFEAPKWGLPLNLNSKYDSIELYDNGLE